MIVQVQGQQDGWQYWQQHTPQEVRLRERVLAQVGTPVPHDVLIARLPSCVDWNIGPLGCTTGTDPEVFAFSPKGDVLPAWEWLPPKDKAEYGQPWAKLRAKHYWDGAQAEITLNGGGACLAWVVDAVQAGLKGMWASLQTHHPGAELRCEDVVKLPLAMRKSAPHDAIMLGCAPSANAYGIKGINIPNPRGHALRYSGTHLHFRHGTTLDALPPHFPEGTAVMMDKVLGVVLTALGRGLENPLRRKAYGRPGEYRVTAPTYAGFEYRTPGAFVLSRPEVFNFACGLGRFAYRLGLMYDGRTFDLLPEVAQIISECDADGACKVIAEHSGLFKGIFRHLHYGCAAQTMKVVQSGLLASFGQVALADAWHLHPTQQWRGHNNENRSTWTRLMDVQTNL